MLNQIKEHFSFALCTLLLGIALLVPAQIATMEKNDLPITQAIEASTQHPFINLPHEKLIEIFNHCHAAQGVNQIQTLAQSIKNFMKISLACKDLHNLLSVETIAELCNEYDLKIKNGALEGLLNSMRDNYRIKFFFGETPIYHSPASTYETIRLPASILISSGADANVTVANKYCLLRHAIYKNDTAFAEKLLKHKADANKKLDTPAKPIFFDVKTKAMAELLVAHGLNLDATAPRYEEIDVLWSTTRPEYPPDMMAYYIECGANPKLSWDNNCILHKLARWVYKEKDLGDYLTKAQLLLNAFPHLVNHKNTHGETVIDIAQKRLEDVKKYGPPYKTVYEKIIDLCREKGGISSQELNEK